MAVRRGRNHSEIDDLSLETTVPTDLSLSADEISDLPTTDEDRHRRSTRSAVQKAAAQQSSTLARQMIEKKHLQNDLQALKIELSQKTYKLENVRSEYMQKIEELEEKLGVAQHQRQVLQSQLDAQISIDKEEARRRQDAIQRELNSILTRQQQLELTNEKLQEKAIDIRRSLTDLELTDAQYHDLRMQAEEDLPLKDFISMKMYEKERPWKLEIESMKPRLKSATEELSRVKQALERCRDELDAEKKQRELLETKYQRSVNSFNEVKGQVQQGDYKIENYDRVKRERDKFEAELTDLLKQHAYIESGYQSSTKERDDFSIEISSLKQAIALLKQDKEYYSKQVTDLQNKLTYSDERALQLTDQLERAKQAREDLYDKYVASREQYKCEYEEKLHRELEQIRIKTNSDIDRLKTSTREMFERENRMLREARDIAISEKDRAIITEKETNTKYEQLMQDYRQQQISSDAKLSEAHSEIKLKTFEAERTQMVYEETVKNLKESQLEQEKMQKKQEVLTKQYYGLQMSLEKRISELEGIVNEKSTKLETYERMEAELDDVVMQAAEIENEDEAERVLFSYGYGANVPTTAKRRLRQSVHLAQRVLHLERANISMRKEVERDQEKIKQLAEELEAANKVLEATNQPHHYLVESIRQRDSQISKLKQQCSSLEADLKRIEKERNELSRAKNQMTVDLERLLNHREEMSVMKQVVLNMKDGGGNMSLGVSKSHRSSPTIQRRAAVPRPASGPKKPPPPRQPNMFEPAERDMNVLKPEPMQFTVNGQPDWYKQLKTKISKDPELVSRTKQTVQ